VNKRKVCYYCGEPATTREHAPPKCFFPPKANLQLKTVPSCEKHNNTKSGDDQYLLTHICMNAGAGDNLPKKIFLNSVVPQLEFSEKFRRMIAHGSQALPGGAVRYKVDLKRFDAFFDGLCHALYFDRYARRIDPANHGLSHIYLSLPSDDAAEVARRDFLNNFLKFFFETSEWMITHYEAAKQADVVYQNKIIDPSRAGLGSVTIAHTFYGIFNVVSLLTLKPSVGEGRDGACWPR
jgi:hypothetical protein